MKKYYSLIFAAIVLSGSVGTSQSKTEGSKNGGPNSDHLGDLPPTEVIIVYGEKVSAFLIGKTGDSPYAKFSSNQDPTRKVRLSLENYNYLMSQLDQFGEPLDKSDTCPRHLVRVTTTSSKAIKTWATCLGAKSSLAKKLMTLTKDLGLLF